MRYTIQSDKLICEIDSHGAELKSVVSTEDGHQAMWNADPSYWNRTSPVLFPFVGAVRNKEYRFGGKTYTIGQHGFARDMEFEKTSQSDDEIWFSLRESAESLEKYPFSFCLKIGYRVVSNTVKVMWMVENTGNDDMWFSIGAHPGFAVKELNGHAFKLYDKNGAPVESIINRVFGTGGCVTDDTVKMQTPGGMLPISERLFDNDALVIENGQIGRVELVDNEKKMLVSVDFDAPLVGLWSPPRKNAPFVCIEPWYGRCDSASFNGELPDRDYEQKLVAGDDFSAEYTIHIGGR